MEILDMDRFRQHSTTRVHPSSFGSIHVGASHCSFTGRSDTRHSQLKRIPTTFNKRSLQSNVVNKMHLWTERKPRGPDIDHKMTSKAHWVVICITPVSFKARANLITQCRLRSHVQYDTIDWPQVTAQGNDSRDMHDTGTTRARIAILKNHLQRGIAIESHTYVKVLQMCLQQKDLSTAKQVHDCIIKSGTDKNPYVASTLLNVYIKSSLQLLLSFAFAFYGLTGR